MSEREPHFQSFAELVYPGLAQLFLAMYGFRVMGEEEAENRVKQMIKTCIAQYADLLAVEVVRHTRAQYDPATGYESKSVEEVITRDVPDMTEWPEESE